MIVDEKHDSFKDLLLQVAVDGDEGEQIDDDMQWYLILLLNLCHVLAKQFGEVSGGIKEAREAQNSLLLLLPPQRIQQ